MALDCLPCSARSIPGTLHLIAPDIARLLDDSVSSIWALDILLLLHGDPAKSWSAAALVRELRASTDVVRQAIPPLSAAGLISEDADGAYRYAAAEEANEIVVRLARVYRDAPATIVRHIASTRDAKLKRFGDAFKFRKD